MLRYDWLICSDVGVSQSRLQSHWWSGSNEYVSHRHVRERKGQCGGGWGAGGGRRGKKNQELYVSIGVIACDLCIRDCVCVCVCV